MTIFNASDNSVAVTALTVAALFVICVRARGLERYCPRDRTGH
jgi:hypothetical protein